MSEKAAKPEKEKDEIADPLFAKFDSMEFEEAKVEFMDFKDLEGVQLNCFLEQKTEMTIRDETKEFVKLYVQVEGGKKMYYAGQKKIIQTFDRYDEGKGVAAKITFLGKVNMKGGKTLNDFEIFASSL